MDHGSELVVSGSRYTTQGDKIALCHDLNARYSVEGPTRRKSVALTGVVDLPRVSFTFRPNFKPRRFAAFTPARVRS